MKAKAVFPSKKKVASTAMKKPISPSKDKAVSTAKKEAVSPSKEKPVSMAKKKLELSNQVTDFVEAAFKGRRIAYFVLNTERKDCAFVVCVAIEGEPGFYKMDWGWHCSFTKAKAETALMNKKLGLTEEEVNEIIISTMGPVSGQR